jgi:hypothetical protein
MEDLGFIEKLKELTVKEDLLAVGRDVNDLRGKFEDYILEEERKVQVAEVETQQANTDNSQASGSGFESRQADLTSLKDEFYIVYNAYRERKKSIIEERNSIEAKNLSAKLTLINELREVVNSEENIGAAFASFKKIQDSWKEIGDISRNKRNEVQGEYSRLLEDFFYNIKIYKELKDHDFQRNLKLKGALIDQLKKLNELKSIKDVESKLKVLQNEWNDIGPVKNETWEALKESYWTEVRSVYDKINRFYDDRRAQLRLNLQEKQALLEQTKTLIPEIEKLESAKAWDKMTKRFLEIRAKWKAVGFGPKKQNDAIWKEFRATCDIFFNAKKEFYGVVNDTFDAIATKKKVLIEKAVALKDSNDWKNTAIALKNLQQKWKELGHSGFRNEQKLWKEFRSACDSFFNSREDFFNEKDKQFENNLKLKEDLLNKIEEYKPNEEKKTALAELKSFASEFNAVGMIPIKQKDSIFNRFKSAMNDHYNALKMEGAEKEIILFEAKIEMLKASPNSSRLLNDMKTDLRKTIDKQQREIAQLENNLGFFASSKGADSLKKEVENKVDRAKERIEGIKTKLKMIPNE